MTLRELVHQQVDMLNPQQLSVLESLLGQLAPLSHTRPVSDSATPSYLLARALLAGQSGVTQALIDGRDERL